MSAILDKVKNRLPGGLYYERFRGTKALKGTEWDFLYQLTKEQLLHGVSSEPAVLTLGKGIDRFRKGDELDFGIIKLPKECDIDGWLIADLILPYLAHNNAFCAEGTYEEFGLAVKQGDIVIDAGANMGVFTAFAAKYRGAEVHAFEPIDETVKGLEKTIAINQIADRVQVVTKALGDRPHEAEIAVTDNVGTSTLVSEMESGLRVTERRKIQITTVDQYVLENKLERIDFIKADIEGSERYMLTGAADTLREFKPQLAICTYHLPDDPEVLTDIIKTANPAYEIQYGRAKLYAK